MLLKQSLFCIAFVNGHQVNCGLNYIFFAYIDIIYTVVVRLLKGSFIGHNTIFTVCITLVLPAVDNDVPDTVVTRRGLSSERSSRHSNHILNAIWRIYV